MLTIIKKMDWPFDMCKAGWVDVSYSLKSRPVLHTSSVHLAFAHLSIQKHLFEEKKYEIYFKKAEKKSPPPPHKKKQKQSG